MRIKNLDIEVVDGPKGEAFLQHLISNSDSIDIDTTGLISWSLDVIRIDATLDGNELNLLNDASKMASIA